MKSAEFLLEKANLEIWWCYLICICWNRSADKSQAIASSMDRSDKLRKMKPGILYFPHCNLCCLMLGVGWLERQSLQGVANDENSFWLKLFSPAEPFSYVLLLPWENGFPVALPWFVCFKSDPLLFPGGCRKFSNGICLEPWCCEAHVDARLQFEINLPSEELLFELPFVDPTLELLNSNSRSSFWTLEISFLSCLQTRPAKDSDSFEGESAATSGNIFFGMVDS